MKRQPKEEPGRVSMLAKALVNSPDYEALKRTIRQHGPCPAGMIPSTPHGAHVQLGWRECEAAFFEILEALAVDAAPPGPDAFGDPFPVAPSKLRFANHAD